MSSILGIDPDGFDVYTEVLSGIKILTNDTLRNELCNLAGVTELVIPEGVESLDCSFGTTQVRKITLPSTIRHIAPGAFDGATDLEEVVFPNKCQMSTLWYSVFRKCYSLRKLDLSSTKIQSIDGRCFSESGLEEIILPKALSNLGAGAFEACQNLRRVTFRGRALKSIQSRTFRGCTSLEEIVLPDTVRHISDFAFEHCRSLRRVVAEGCGRIEAFAFKGAPGIYRLDMSSVISYYENSFEPGVIEHTRPKSKPQSIGVGTTFNGIHEEFVGEDKEKAYQEGKINAYARFVKDHVNFV